MSYKDPKPHEIDVYATAWVLEKNEKTYCYKKTFPSSKANPKTLNEYASKFHAHAKVRTRIEQLQALSAKQTEEEFGLSISQKKRILAEVIKIGMNKDEELDKPQLGDVVRAINEMNKMDGSHAAEKRTVGGDKANPLQILVGQISGATLEPGQILGEIE